MCDLTVVNCESGYYTSKELDLHDAKVFPSSLALIMLGDIQLSGETYSTFTKATL